MRKSCKPCEACKKAGETMVKSILLPTDFSNSARRALEWARQEFPAATITLLHVVDVATLSSPSMDLMGPLGMQDDTVQEVRQQATEQLQQLQRQGEEVLLKQGHPVQAILEAIRELEPDLVVMGTHGRQGFNHLVFGSVAEGVVRRSPVPVMVAREPATVSV